MLFFKKKRLYPVSDIAAPDGVEIVGVYRVPNDIDVSLVEMTFNCPPTDLEIDKIMQKKPHVKKGDEQVPYNEVYLSADGTTKIGEAFSPPKDKSTTRICFFLYFVDQRVPLSTQFGYISLPPSSDIPDRLKNIITLEKDIFD